MIELLKKLKIAYFGVEVDEDADGYNHLYRETHRNWYLILWTVVMVILGLGWWIQSPNECGLGEHIAGDCSSYCMFWMKAVFGIWLLLLLAVFVIIVIMAVVYFIFWGRYYYALITALFRFLLWPIKVIFHTLPREIIKFFRDNNKKGTIK